MSGGDKDSFRFSFLKVLACFFPISTVLGKKPFWEAYNASRTAKA